MSANLADYKLFKPLELAAGLTLQNRMVFSPCTRARSDIKTRCPNDENVKYYAARASAGLILSESCAVSEQGYGWYGAPALYMDEQQEGWRKIVEAVHAEGGKIFLQLWHMGRQSHPSFHPSNEVASCSSSCYADGRTHDAEGNATGFPTTREMTLQEVKQVIEDFRKCAERAKAAGFDGVEFHGAGGYLIDEFLQSCTNTPVSVALLEHCADGLDLMDPADQALWGICVWHSSSSYSDRRSWPRRGHRSVGLRSPPKTFQRSMQPASPQRIPAWPRPRASDSEDPRRIKAGRQSLGCSPALVTRCCARFGALFLRQARGRLPPSIPAAMFTGKNGVPSCVTTDRLTNAIQRAVRGIGEDPTRYSARSLRSGGATCMYEAGVDAIKIQFHGRWASDTYKIYTRLNQESVASVAAMMTGRAERPREH